MRSFSVRVAAVHPSDRLLVETWANATSGRTLDAGCGPGHWSNHLHGIGVDVHGIDLVPEFIEHARSTYPTVDVRLGDIDAIEERDDTLGGILFARVLRPGGILLLGYFDGDRVEPFDHAVVRAYRWPAHDLHLLLESVGFEIIETHVRVERGRRPVGAILCERRDTRSGG